MCVGEREVERGRGREVRSNKVPRSSMEEVRSLLLLSCPQSVAGSARGYALPARVSLAGADARTVP